MNTYIPRTDILNQIEQSNVQAYVNNEKCKLINENETEANEGPNNSNELPRRCMHFLTDV